MDQTEHIHYGSLITLHTHDLHFLFSHGFIDTNLYLKSASDYDFIGNVFRIIPSSMYTAQSEVLASISEITDDDHIHRLEDIIEAEIESNLLSYKNLKGKSIKFGSLIQLEHFKSHKFLSIKSNQSADIEKENIKTSLEDYGGAHSIFKIQPCFNYQKEGNLYVKNNDKIILEITLPNLNKCLYLHRSTGLFTSVLNVGVQSSLEVNASFEQKSQWVVDVYSNCNLTENQVCCGDYLWIVPSEEKFCLGGFGKRFKLCFSENHTDTNGLWMIEYNDHKIGGNLSNDGYYNLKHLSSGKYLSLKKYKGKYKLSLADDCNRNTLWKVENLSGEKCMVYEDYFRIFNKNKKLWISNQTDSKLNKISSHGSNLTETPDEFTYFKFVKAENEIIWETLFLLNSYPILCNFPRFLADSPLCGIQNYNSYINLTLKCLIELMLFCSNSLQSMVRVDNQLGEVQIKRQRLLRETKFIDALAGILSVTITTLEERELVKTIKSELVSPLDVPASPLFKKESKETNIEVVKMKLLLPVVENVYKLLSAICKDNKDTQTYTYQYFRIFIKHIGLDLWATNCMLEILKDNEELLLDIHEVEISENSENIIELYSNLLKESKNGKKPQLLEFLKNICTFKGKGISVNQEKVFEYLFDNKEIYNSIIVPIRVEENSMFVEVSADIYVQLERCFNFGLIIDHECIIIYITKLIELFANMCLSRNFVCINILSDIFSADLILKIIRNENITPELRAAFSKLMLTVYIDIPPREEVIKPELIKVLHLENRDNKITIPKTNSKTSSRNNSDNTKSTFKYIEVSLNDNDFLDVYKEEAWINVFLFEILSYFEKIDQKNIDTFTHEILRISDKLVKFERYGTLCTDYQKGYSLINPFTKTFEIENMDIVKFIKAVSFLLFKDSIGQGVCKTTSYRKSKIPKIYKLTNQEKSIIETDTITRSAKNLKNLLSCLKNNPNSCNLTFINRCKIKVSKIMGIYLDLRQEFFLTNVVKWFSHIKEQKVWTTDEIVSLLPPIMEIGNFDRNFALKSILNGMYDHNFSVWNAPLIPDFNFIAQKHILGSLLKGFVYIHDYKLKFYIWSLIIRCFSQRSELLKSIKHLHVLNSDTDIDLIQWLKLQLSVFKTHSERSEIWLDFWRPENRGHRKTVDKITDILSDLEILLYQKSFIISSRPERSQESAICKSRQEMFNYLGVHELVVKLLKDGMHTLEFLHEQGLEMPMKKLGDLFSRCHRLLQSFVHHNPKNQKCLYKYLHIFLQYLKLDAGQIPLICEIYKNNTKLISKLTLDCFKPFKNLIYQSGRQPVFLDFFEVILKVKGNYLQETQRLVINIFVDEEIDRFLLYMNNEKESDFVFTEGNRNRNYKDVPFEYHSRLIQILSKCGIGVNGMYMTEAKCQKIIPLKIVFKILTLCDVSSQFEMLRIPLIEFLFNNYLDCEKLYDEMKIASDFFIYTNVQAQKLEEIELISSDYLKFLKIFVKCLNKYCESFLSVCDITSNKEDYISLQRFAYILSRNDHKFMNIKLENGLISEIQLLCLKFNYELPVIKHEYISTADSNDYSLSDENIEECKDTVGEYWNQARNVFIYKEEIRGKVIQEKSALKIAIYFSHEMSRKLSFGIIGKALLKFISQSKLHRLHSKIMIQSFELLSSMIIDPIIDKKKVKDIQNELCSYGAGKVAIQLMCNTDLNEDLFNSVLDFSTSLVKGGNKQAQNQYYHYLINSGSSIIFFERIHGILVDTIEDNSKVSHSLYKPVYKKSYNSTRNILNFLKELSRHHDKIKSYLNIQENSKESYNVVEDVIFLLEFMLKKMRISNFYLICDCMDWLFVYTTGPNKSYQDIIIDCKFVDLAVRIFYLNENSDDLEDFEIFGRKQANVMNDEEVEHIKGWMISIIKYKCMRIIMNSLEGRDDNYHIAKMIRIFSFELLEENLVNVYSNYVRYYGKKVYNSDVFKHYALDTIKIEDYHRIVIETGFMIYELIQHFHDTCHSKTLKFDFGETIVDPYNSHLPSLWKFLLIPFVIFKQHQKSRQKLTSNKRVLLEKAYSFFKKHTGNIEIVYDKCKLYKIYFILPPEFQGLNQSIKNKFHLEVDRTSNHTKLQFLIDESKDIIDQIKHEQRLHRLFSKYNMFSIVTFNVILWQDVTFVLTVLINFLMVYSYSDYNNQDPDKPKLFYHDLSTYDTLVTFRTLGTFLVISSLMALIISLIKEVPIIAKRIFISKILANKSLFRMKYRDIAINLKHTYLTILSILNQKNILFSLIFLVFAILGTIYHPFFFSVVLLMAVVSKYHTLKHIINAFYVSKSTLIATFILMILIIYVFSIIGYAVLTSDFTGHCPSLLVCWIYIFDSGFKNNGGIGSSLTETTPGKLDYVRLLYDNAYNIIVVIILLNIVQGIIIDTFGEVREKNKYNEHDRLTKCFICGLERDYIERITDRPFKYHIYNEHNEWNYVLYIAYILNKDQEEYSGIERYIRELYDLKDIRWLPSNQGLSINK